MPDRIMTATPPAAGVVLVLLALLAPAAAPPARGADTGPATRPAAAAAATRIDLPSYGVSVPVPQGFARDTDAQNTVAVLIPSGGPPETPRQLLWLDVFAKQDGSLADFVRQLGEDGGMEPGRKDLKWGDRPAVELVSKRVPGEKLTAIRQLATERDGYLFRLQYAVTNKADPARTEPYEQFVRETRWLPIATAGQGVARRTPAFPLSNGMIVNIPDPFRPDMKSPSKIVRAFQAQDLATGKNVAKLTVIPMPEEEGPYTLDGLKKEVRENLEASLNLKVPMQWAADSGPAGPVAFAATPRMAAANGSVQILVASAGGRAATVFNLQWTDQKPGEGMERVIPLLTESIRAEAPAATRPATTRPATTRPAEKPQR